MYRGRVHLVLLALSLSVRKRQGTLPLPRHCTCPLPLFLAPLGQHPLVVLQGHCDVDTALVGRKLDKARRSPRAGSPRRARRVLVPDGERAPTDVPHTTMRPPLSSQAPKDAVALWDPLPAPARLCGGPVGPGAQTTTRAHSDVADHLLRPLTLGADAAPAPLKLGLGDSRGPRPIPRARSVRGSVVTCSSA